MKTLPLSRRRLLQQMAYVSAAAMGASVLPGCKPGSTSSATNAAAQVADEGLYRISLAQWSLHRAFQGGEMNPLQFPTIAREQFGFDGVEYVSQLYDAPTKAVVDELKRRSADAGVTNVLLMIDHQGALGDADEAARRQAVDNHMKWAEAAHVLGCHSVRVNAQSSGTYEEQMQRAADGLVQLAERCAPLNLNVLVENHGGLSSNGQWLAGVMKTANHPRVGTLPDFGNFTINYDTNEQYDRYKGVQELLPYAKAVSAKTHEFDEAGNEIHTDYRRMMKMVVDSGYRGWIGIEYEGDKHSEPEGIRLTRDLLLQVEKELMGATLET